MSVPRLIVAGLEPGPAVDLAAGALLAGFGEQRTVRRCCSASTFRSGDFSTRRAAKAPRVVDPALHAMPSPRSCTTTGPRRSTRCWSWRRAPPSTAGRASRARAPSTSPRASMRRLCWSSTRATAAPRLPPPSAACELWPGMRDGRAHRRRRRRLRRRARAHGECCVAMSALPLGAIPPQLSEQFVRQRAAAASGVRTWAPSRPRAASSGSARGGDLPAAGRAGGRGGSARLSAGAAAAGARAATRRRRSESGRRLGAAAGAAWRSRTSTCYRRWVSSSCRSTSPATGSCLRASAGCCIAGQLDEAQLAAFAENRELHRRAGRARSRGLADPGDRRRRLAAAAAPRRQSRAQPRAGRGRAGRGRAHRVV